MSALAPRPTWAQRKFEFVHPPWMLADFVERLRGLVPIRDETHLRQDAMRDQRVTEGEVLAAVRGARIARLEEVEAVVLETDGSLSVVPRPSGGPATSLRDVADADVSRR